MRVIGLAGWSGAGKTTLLTRLIPVLAARGLRVATLKHAHHAFDVDPPGKDSRRHRDAGAQEVIVSSARRSVQIREVGEGAEPTLAGLLRRLGPCDLVLVEGFKRAAHPKLEVFRAAAGRPALHPEDDRIVAVASDRPFPRARVPVLDLDDVAGIAEVVLARSDAIGTVLERLERHGAAD
ncbi:Molybdopterin-guanine dinucleotide biosynthesis adapter protein [Methylobacterium crusticola]|uniref:Molybdopterin-guanine dinucleotide biosynthesis adapter protein n=1 Tax=Methylobacterium crusticola TaxID=1697972 RepID=A0ABQ4QTU9_9HYPH|nr:molybdopterin-guanine dinucleotide biosynthesis protein B [Methylobacterium crusticola]GJD48723.1 Molybdopterin-guanine dinucleotide biosynthesis adapter protein [Methylobacterium crusticola]